ncbi:hypothetical protein ACFQ51_55585 [Streptomyces kaempferi]
MASTLVQLAYALDAHGSPIDYARRPATFTYPSIEFDHYAFQRLCNRHGWRTGQEHRTALLRWYLLMLLTGKIHPRPAMPTLDSPGTAPSSVSMHPERFARSSASRPRTTSPATASTNP